MSGALTASLKLTLEDKLSGGLSKLTGLLDKLGALARKLSFDNIGRGAGAIQRATQASSGLSGMLGGIVRRADQAAAALGRMGGAAVRAGRAAGGRAVDYSNKVGAVGTAVEGYSLYRPIETYAGFENTLRHIAITEGLSGKAVDVEVKRLAQMLNEEALRTGQRSEELAAAYNFLITTGMKASTVDRLMPAHAQAATAYNVPSDSMGQAVFALHDSFKIAEEDMPAALAAMARAAKEGHFNVESFSRFLPLIGGRMNMLGMTGRKSADTSFAALETVVKNSADPGTAATNFGDLLHYMTAPIAVRSFKKAGIDLPRMYEDAKGKGINPLYAFLGKLEEQVRGKDDVEASLTLGKLLHNQQAGDAALSLVKHKDQFLELQKLLDTVNKTTIDTDYKTARDAPMRDLEAAKEGATQTERTFGRGFSAMLAPINFVEQALLRIFGFLDDHVPGATSAVLGTVGAFLLLGTAVGAVGLALPAIKAGAALLALPGLAARINLLWLGMRIALIDIGELVAGVLGVSLGWIALIAVALGAAAYLIYRYWTPIKRFFIRLWDGIKTGWGEMIDGLTDAWARFAAWFEGTFPQMSKSIERLADKAAAVAKPFNDAMAHGGGATAPGGVSPWITGGGNAGGAVKGEIVVRPAPGAEVTHVTSTGPVRVVPAKPQGRGGTLDRQKR